MKTQIIQPWSVPVVKTTLPPEILQTMIEISDQVLIDKEAESAGPLLAGQIEKELEIEHDILRKTKVFGFFMESIREFVIICKCQRMPDMIDVIQQEEWLTQMLGMWIVSQQPGEYNPMHSHDHCQVSAVMFLKVPKMLPSRKEHRPHDDGSIVFTSSPSRDLEFSAPNSIHPPHVGDFYIFGAHQQHQVYPFRCAEGQKETERRSISFNAIFQLKEALS